MADMIKKGILMHIVMAIVCAMCSFVGGLTLSVVMGALLYAAYVIVMYGEGCGFGEHACTVRDTVNKLKAENKTVSDNLEKEVYEPKKGVYAAIILAAPLVLLAIVNIVFANKGAQETVIGVVTRIFNLPCAFMTRWCTESIVTEIEGAKKATLAILGAFDFGSVGVEGLTSSLKDIGTYGSALDVSSLTLMRWLFIPAAILPPAAMCVGYLQGPRLREKTVKDMLKGSRKKKKKLKMFGGPKQHKTRGPEI